MVEKLLSFSENIIFEQIDIIDFRDIVYGRVFHPQTRGNKPLRRHKLVDSKSFWSLELLIIRDLKYLKIFHEFWSLLLGPCAQRIISFQIPWTVGFLWRKNRVQFLLTLFYPLYARNQ